MMTDGNQILNGKTDSKFQLVHKSSYLKLKELLKKRLPISTQLYNTVQLAVTATGPEKDSGFQFYTYHGILDDHSIIVGRDCIKVKVTDMGIPVLILSVHTPEILTMKIANEFIDHFSRTEFDELSIGIERRSSAPIIYALLNKGSILNIKSCNMFNMIDDNYIPGGHENGNSKKEFEENDYIVKSLEPKDGKIVADHWTYGSWNKPEYYATTCIETNPSCGVYSKKTGELMCWSITYHFGSFGMLFTVEKFRGQGLSKIVMKYLIEQLKERGLHPGTGVEPRNIISANLMTKSGLKNTHPMDFIFTQ